MISGNEAKGNTVTDVGAVLKTMKADSLTETARAAVLYLRFCRFNPTACHTLSVLRYCGPQRSVSLNGTDFN